MEPVLLIDRPPVPHNPVKSVVEVAPNILPNILIVDDRKENLVATEKVLKNLDATIFKATSGNEALSLMLRNRFALVLLDVQMPEMNGFETAMLMQEHESMAGVPIIFVTAISKEERYATQAAEIGAVDYIFKPINPDILRSKVKVYLDLYIQHEQIMKLNKTLSQSNEELERFAYICSHDMQEPVRMMNSYAELLMDDYEPLMDEQAQKYLNHIMRSAHHMQKMIFDILTFSRVGREDPKIETFDCHLLFQEVLNEFEDIILQKQAHIIYDPLPVMEGCPTLMRVLFQNLMGNALKFQNGVNSPAIKIKAQTLDNNWLFCVSDNGIGIDPVFNERVFAIFQRIHRKEDYPGTGIGLSTCKKFIELYGGKIWFKSILCKGTDFFFTIPRHSEQLL